MGVEDIKVRPNDNFPYPFMDCCFTKDNNLFVVMFFPNFNEMTMAQFNPFEGLIIRTPIVEPMEQVSGCQRNFPLGTYYDEDRQNIYIFFRQGQAYILPLNYPKNTNL